MYSYYCMILVPYAGSVLPFSIRPFYFVFLPSLFFIIVFTMK